MILPVQCRCVQNLLLLLPIVQAALWHVFRVKTCYDSHAYRKFCKGNLYGDEMIEFQCKWNFEFVSMLFEALNRWACSGT